MLHYTTVSWLFPVVRTDYKTHLWANFFYITIQDLKIYLRDISAIQP